MSEERTDAATDAMVATDANRHPEEVHMRNAMISIVTIIALSFAGIAMAGDKADCTNDGDEGLAKLKAKIASKGWLGVETDKVDVGYFKVKKVYEGSPAEAAGFQEGDVVLAINGVKCTEENAKAALKKTGMKPGAEATYVVKRSGEKVKLTAQLGHVPEKVAKMWIAEYQEKQADARMAKK
jgi:predicted metalloprotease with PDZ domain